jgi:AraC-like DNA-binding protein
MLVTNLFQPFEIEYKELDECPVGTHRNTFFELIYIVRGSGIQHVNDNSFRYGSDHLFLVMPQDSHRFEVTGATVFLVIKFHDIYLKVQQAREQHSNLAEWVPNLEYIFQHTSHLPGCILHNQSDKPFVKAITEAIIHEYVNRQPFRQEVIQQLVNTLITIVARNVSLMLPEKNKLQAGGSIPQDIIHYIHRHIYSPEKLRAEHIAAHFNISLNYISEYFKKHTGENLLQYITAYKLRLAETRLRYSSLRINEIAYELGFTDESHLNRAFKKYRGQSPSEFRKAAREEREAPNGQAAAGLELK